MLKTIGQVVLASILVISLFFNGALVFSSVVYSFAYRVLSNSVSTLYDGTDFSSSMGWKQKQLKDQVVNLKQDLSSSLVENNKLVGEINDLEIKSKELKNKASVLNEKIKVKSNEINALKKSNGNLTQSIRKKMLELDTLKLDFQDVDSRYKDTLNKVDILKATNVNIKNDLLKTQKSVDKLKNDLSLSNSSNSKLSDQIVKNGMEIDKLKKKTLRQVEDLNAAKVLVREATGRVSNSIDSRVLRNLAAMPIESVPVAGIAITVGLVYLEIQDACNTMKEFKELTSKIGGEGVQEEEEAWFCSLSKEDLYALISSEKIDYSKCWDQTKSPTDIDINELLECRTPPEPTPGSDGGISTIPSPPPEPLP
jgi:hypothetical protein